MLLQALAMCSLTATAMQATTALVARIHPPQATCSAGRDISASMAQCSQNSVPMGLISMTLAGITVMTVHQGTIVTLQQVRICTGHLLQHAVYSHWMETVQIYIKDTSAFTLL